MDCEREECGHPLALHDPCTAKGCACQAYEPADRKTRAAAITDIPDRGKTLGQVRAEERRRLGGVR